MADGVRRLFFALWPNEAERQACLRVMSLLTPEAGLRLTRPENLHVTLLFLGWVGSDRLSGLLDAAAGLPPPRGELRFDALSYWRGPKVACLTCENFPPAFAETAARLKLLAEASGLELDNRGFKPHVTLARTPKPPQAVKFAPVYWRGGGFCLAESLPHPEGGVRYHVLRHWPGLN